MGFSSNQLRALRRDVDRRNLRSRQTQNGRALTYIEGWHAVAEANRIFGFGGWDRETVESRCILAREIRGAYVAIYVARVRITVRANGETVIREGHGTGEGKGALPGEAHDMAVKTAETDATKRALATFGKPFGLSLYLSSHPKKGPAPAEASALAPPPLHPATGAPDFERRRTRQRLGPNGRYYVPPRTEPNSDAFHAVLAGEAKDGDLENESPENPPAAPDAASSADLPIAPSASATTKAPPDDVRQQLAAETSFLIAHPRRARDKDHLLYVGTQPCLLCGRTPSDAHHLRYAQPRAMSRKVSDEFTVPVCRTHHRQLHQSGDEVAWWNDLGVDPLPIAQELWQQSRGHTTGNGHAGVNDAGRSHAHAEPNDDHLQNNSPVTEPPAGALSGEVHRRSTRPANGREPA